LPIWAGVVPTGYAVGTPVPDERNLPGLDIPGHVRDYKL